MTKETSKSSETEELKKKLTEVGKHVNIVALETHSLIVPLHDLLAGLARHEPLSELEERLIDLRDAFEALEKDLTPPGLTILCMLLARLNMEVGAGLQPVGPDRDPSHTAYNLWMSLAMLISKAPVGLVFDGPTKSGQSDPACS